MKYLYFCDSMGEPEAEQERDVIKDTLSENGINIDIEVIERPTWDQDFDVLFFDWGGMSVGNDMMGSFCRHFVEDARNKPNRLYIMTSSFTKEAMVDALETMRGDHEEDPKNVFLTVEDAVPLLKEWEKPKA